MALTADVKMVRYGTPGGGTQPVNQPVKAAAVVYRGSVAITRSGYVVAATSPASATDIVWGIIESAGPGTANLAPGITGGATDGAVTVEIATGTFFLASATGGGAITQANVGAVCYLLDETTVTMTAGSLPIAGVIEAYDTTYPGALGPVAVKLGTNSAPGGPS
jgi:hypothetical protein